MFKRQEKNQSRPQNRPGRQTSDDDVVMVEWRFYRSGVRYINFYYDEQHILCKFETIFETTDDDGGERRTHGCGDSTARLNRRAEWWRALTDTAQLSHIIDSPQISRRIIRRTVHRRGDTDFLTVCVKTCVFDSCRNSVANALIGIHSPLARWPVERSGESFRPAASGTPRNKNIK